MIVFATCHDENTRISFEFAKGIAHDNDTALFEKDATHERLLKVLNENSKKPLMGFSHGLETGWVDQNNKIVFEGQDFNILEKRAIFSYSCLTARELGQKTTNLSDCIYWGYSDKVLIGSNIEGKTLESILNAFRFIRESFHVQSDKHSILKFLNDLKQLCDSLQIRFIQDNAIEYVHEWVLGLSMTLRDLWAKLVVSFDNSFISHSERIEPLLW